MHMNVPCPSVRFAEGSLLAMRRERIDFENHITNRLEHILDTNLPTKHFQKEALFFKERDATMRAGHGRFDLLGPIGPPCWDLQTFGARRIRGAIRDMEAKMACGLEGFNASCVVVSLGSNGQWTFEEDVFSRTNCRVEVFDCTVDPEEVTVPVFMRHRVRLHHHCVGPPPKSKGKRRIYNWKVRQFVNTTRTLSFVSYEQALQLSGIQTAPTFLKMDIEGYEWSVLPQLLDNGATSPSQVAMELHFQTQMPGLSWFGRLKSPAELLALGTRLANAGYVISQRNDNPNCGKCTELLLVRDPCGERRV